MSCPEAKKYVADNLQRSPRNKGWTLPMPSVTAYDAGSGVRFVLGDWLMETLTGVACRIAEILMERELEVARRERQRLMIEELVKA